MVLLRSLHRRLLTKPAVMIVRRDARFTYYPTADAAWCVIMAGSEREHIVGIHRNVRIPRWQPFGQWRVQA